MNVAPGLLLLVIGVIQVSLDSTWFCISMLWSAGGFLAGIGVGYIIRLAQERLGRHRNDDDT